MSKIKEFYLKYSTCADSVAISIHCGPLLCTLGQAHLMNRHQHVGHHEIRYSDEASNWTKCVDQGYFMQLKFRTHYMKKAEHSWQEDSPEALCFTAIADSEEKLIDEFEKYIAALPYEFIIHPRRNKK